MPFNRMKRPHAHILSANIPSHLNRLTILQAHGCFYTTNVLYGLHVSELFKMSCAHSTFQLILSLAEKLSILDKSELFARIVVVVAVYFNLSFRLCFHTEIKFFRFGFSRNLQKLLRFKKCCRSNRKMLPYFIRLKADMTTHQKSTHSSKITVLLCPLSQNSNANKMKPSVCVEVETIIYFGVCVKLDIFSVHTTIY